MLVSVKFTFLQILRVLWWIVINNDLDQLIPWDKSFKDAFSQMIVDLQEAERAEFLHFLLRAFRLQLLRYYSAVVVQLYITVVQISTAPSTQNSLYRIHWHTTLKKMELDPKCINDHLFKSGILPGHSVSPKFIFIAC